MITQYLLFLFLGLQATLHCVGMCGPLAFAAPINKNRIKFAILGSLSYNFGRMISYAYLGMLIYLIGLQTWMLNAVQWISILTGVMLLLTTFLGAIDSWPIIRIFSSRFGLQLSKLFPYIKNAPRFSQPLLFGIINGFLPCGMVYIALFYSLSATDLFSAVFSMFLFGLGTIPVMFFIPLMKQQERLQRLPKYTQKVLLLLLGVLLILRGLGLGIPFLSPEIKSPVQQHQLPSIECCEVQ